MTINISILYQTLELTQSKSITVMQDINSG